MHKLLSWHIRSDPIPVFPYVVFVHLIKKETISKKDIIFTNHKKYQCKAFHQSAFDVMIIKIYTVTLWVMLAKPCYRSCNLCCYSPIPSFAMNKIETVVHRNGLHGYAPMLLKRVLKTERQQHSKLYVSGTRNVHYIHACKALYTSHVYTCTVR